MTELRFSTDQYRKIPPAALAQTGKTRLLEVLLTSHQLSGAFIGYDTDTADPIKEPGLTDGIIAQLTSGKPQMVLLLSSKLEKSTKPGQLWTTIRRLTKVRLKQLMNARGQEVRLRFPGGCYTEPRKAKLVAAFPPSTQVRCPGFFKLVLSNGCPYKCSYCYLKGTLRSQKYVRLFNNPWPKVEAELQKAGPGIFNTGELGDSLAIEPPLLKPAIEYFRGQDAQTMLLVTKAGQSAVDILGKLEPTPQVIVSFSINDPLASTAFEHGAPRFSSRLGAARALIDSGWRVRVRLDPILLTPATTPRHYLDIAHELSRSLGPVRFTIGSLRPYRAVAGQMPPALKEGLELAPDGRMRYSIAKRIEAYQAVADGLGYQPALCKEPKEIWQKLGWQFAGCNCTK